MTGKWHAHAPREGWWEAGCGVRGGGRGARMWGMCEWPGLRGTAAPPPLPHRHIACRDGGSGRPTSTPVPLSGDRAGTGGAWRRAGPSGPSAREEKRHQKKKKGVGRWPREKKGKGKGHRAHTEKRPHGHKYSGAGRRAGACRKKKWGGGAYSPPPAPPTSAGSHGRPGDRAKKKRGQGGYKSPRRRRRRPREKKGRHSPHATSKRKRGTWGGGPPPGRPAGRFTAAAVGGLLSGGGAWGENRERGVRKGAPPAGKGAGRRGPGRAAHGAAGWGGGAGCRRPTPA